MQRLFPDRAPLALEELYDGLVLEPGPPQRPHTALGMVASLDGAASVAGRTARLGGDADRVAFSALRAATDAILVGAGTVRTEGYGPAAGSATRRAARTARGLAPSPRLVVVSASLSISRQHPVFADPEHPPVLLTTEHARSRAPSWLSDAAELIALPGDAVDPARGLAALGQRGIRRVLCEGGPDLAARLLAADLIDEIFLTQTPLALAGPAPRIMQGDGPDLERDFTLVTVHEHEGELLLRYQRSRPADR